MDFKAEISVILARGRDGRTAVYPVAENLHRGGILHATRAPARIPADVSAKAVALARQIAESLGHVGVMAVEMFLLHDESLLVNEIAPRVHNSGHRTIEACAVDQFEQHIRAVCGWPLGDGSRHSDAVMTNLIGDEADDWRGLAADPGVSLHLYGKAEARPGRKMGHVTRLSPRR